MEEASELITYFQKESNEPNILEEYFEYTGTEKIIDENKMYGTFEFENEEKKLSKLKEWKLISPTANTVKTIYYKGAYTDTPIECEVIGYRSIKNSEGCINKYFESAIISIAGEIRTILPEYLKQMQSSKFNRFSIEENEE